MWDPGRVFVKSWNSVGSNLHTVSIQAKHLWTLNVEYAFTGIQGSLFIGDQICQFILLKTIVDRKNCCYEIDNICYSLHWASKVLVLLPDWRGWWQDKMQEAAITLIYMTTVCLSVWGWSAWRPGRGVIALLVWAALELKQWCQCDRRQRASPTMLRLRLRNHNLCTNLWLSGGDWKRTGIGKITSNVDRVVGTAVKQRQSAAVCRRPQTKSPLGLYRFLELQLVQGT